MKEIKISNLKWTLDKMLKPTISEVYYKQMTERFLRIINFEQLTEYNGFLTEV